MPILTLDEFCERTIAPLASVRAVSWMRVELRANDLDDEFERVLQETKETVIGIATVATTITRCEVTPAQEIVGSVADFATVTVSKRSTAGVATELGSVTTEAGWFAGVPVPIDLTGATVQPGEILTVRVEKSGGGVALPALVVEALPEKNFIVSRVEHWESYLNDRLSKRYAVPFASPVPTILKGWCTALVTLDLYSKLGFNPSSKQDDEAIVQAAQRAREEIKEAADSKDGLFELPLRADTNERGISRGGPLAYSEASPYEWTDVQAEAVRNG